MLADSNADPNKPPGSQPSADASRSGERTEEFLELLTRHDRAISSYVQSLVPAHSDAEDILQETKVALWRSFEQFQPGTSFAAWARKAAYYRVLDYRKRKSRERQRLWFTETCYELLADQYEQAAERRDQQAADLRDCISRLPANHRQILTLRYFGEATIEDVAMKVDRTVEATYRVLSRIRLTLRRCLHSKFSSN